jgi:excisionase family DNA binding protein
VSTKHTAVPSAERLEGINLPYPRPMTKAELAEFLGVSPRTVDNYVSARRIPFIKLGPRLVRFRLADVERALKRYTISEVSL